MPQQVDARLLRQIDLIADYGRLTLSGLESVIGYQLNHAHALIERSADGGPCRRTETPAEWPETLQDALREQAGATRECLRLSAAIQSQMMRLVERQSREAQDILADVQARVLAALSSPADNEIPTASGRDSVAARPGRGLVSASEQEQRLAA